MHLFYTRSKKGQTLAATLVVVAIIGILAVALYFGGILPFAKQTGATTGGTTITGEATGLSPVTPGEVQGPQSTLGVVKERAESVQCQSALGQIRQALAGEVEKPATLQQLGLPATCPDSGAAYSYDPNSGTVKCPNHPNY